jgi:fructose-1-phosphate kinase PfkB-like protein
MNVLAVGPNPAYQKAVEIPHFEPFVVNRSTNVRACAGGKGIHFAKAANRIQPGCATVAHLLGGDTGKAIHEWCREDGPQLVTWTSAPTRTCTTLLCQETNRMTEIIEPTGALTEAEIADFKSQVTMAAAKADVVALCGTYPSCLGEHFYAEVAAANPDALVVLDGYRGVDAVLSSGRVDVLKINEYELTSLTGEKDLLAAGELALSKWSLQWLGITAGPDAAALFGRDCHWRFRIPPVDKVANPIGAGDTVSAVFTLGLAAGDAPEKAFAHGLAAATESCLSMTGADFDPAAARARAEAVVIEPLAAEVGS